MAAADYAAWKVMRDSPRQFVRAGKSALTVVAGRMMHLWATGPDAGSAPTTAAAPDDTTTGSLKLIGGLKNIENPSSGANRITKVVGNAGQPGTLIICDRLSHQGGLSGTTTGAQTTNLATAALTRYTSGVGVFAALDITTQVGTTGTTVTASYTDDGGTAGNTSAATNFGATGYREAGRSILLPLAAGDLGVRAVASVTLAASTLTAGAFGVTLFKPLLYIPILAPGRFEWDPLLDGGGFAPSLANDACLELRWIGQTTTTGGIEAVIHLAED